MAPFTNLQISRSNTAIPVNVVGGFQNMSEELRSRYQMPRGLANRCLENLDPRPAKLRPSWCLKNSDLKNSNPLGASKSQT